MSEVTVNVPSTEEPVTEVEQLVKEMVKVTVEPVKEADLKIPEGLEGLVSIVNGEYVMNLLPTTSQLKQSQQTRFK